MALPSLDSGWQGKQRVKPRIYMLEVRDRDKPEGAPIAWLLVERQETCRRDERDGSIWEASIRISYERVAPKNSRESAGKGYFSGGYFRGYLSNSDPCVSLTSESMGKGTVFLDLPGLHGQRIGTYFMNEIVAWVQQWPGATVRRVELLEGQAHDDNKARRNRFYEQFGLEFDYRDPEHREGLSRPMLAGALMPVQTWQQNLRERDVREYLADVLRENERVNFELKQRERAIASLRGELRRAEARPVRWALRQTWWRLAPVLGQLAAWLAMAALVWSAFKVKS